MLTFRDATEADLPAIVALLAGDVMGRGREDPGPPLPGVYAAAFQRMTAQGGTIVLAEQDNTVIGCFQINIIHGVSHKGQTRAQVEAVRVMEAHRGQGIGAALMQEAIRLARANGCGLIQLTTNLERLDAQRFYRRLGFKQSHAGMKMPL